MSFEKLNSHNDWDPLKEIIVGSAENYLSHDRDISFDLFFHENIYKSDWAYPRLLSKKNNQSNSEQQLINKRYVEELHEDVENLASVIQK